MIKIEKEYSYGIIAIVAIVAIIALFNLSSTRVITTTDSEVSEAQDLAGEAFKIKDMVDTISIIKQKKECDVLGFVNELNMLLQRNPTAQKIKNIVKEYNCEGLMGDATLPQLSLLLKDITPTPGVGP